LVRNVIKGLKYGTNGNRSIIYFDWFIRSVSDLAPLLFSVIWAQLIDSSIKGIQSGNLDFKILLFPFILYGIIELSKAVLTWLDEYLQNRIFDILELKLHVDVIKKYASLDVQSLEDPEVNRLFQVIRGPYDWRIRHLIFTFGRLLSATLLIGTSAFVLLQISPLVMVIIIASAIPSVLINMKFGSISWGIWHEDANKHRKFNLTREFLLEKNNLIEASINNIVPHLVGVIRKILNDYHEKRKPVLRKRAYMMLLGDIVRIVGSVGSVYLLIILALESKISIGQLVLGSSVFISFSGSLSSFLYELTETFNSGLFIEDFMKFLGLQSKMKVGVIKLSKTEKPPRIEFENVSFKYPNTDRLILKDIDLLIEPGMKVALVGENGVGKTTLIKILSRFYELDNGRILIDGQDLSDIDTECWEKNLGLLTQHFNTYPAFNVEENIYFGDVSKKLNKREIIEAAEKAHVTNFVNKYPKGFDQLLSIQFEGGIDPSWGQWQRLGIARTLYRNPSIIILDEPTSAIDAQAEYEIFQNINDQTEGKTVIYVSHRYSTVRNADLICVLKDGYIVERGTHSELMRLNGEYAKNFNLQAKGYE